MAGVGVLYICTGRYRKFWERFYETAEQHFLQGHTKHYYVWSNYPVEEGDNVTHIPCSWEGWPNETLNRFSRFCQLKKSLQDCTYLYFFNANIEFLEDVGEEVLPDIEHRLVAAAHAFHWDPVKRTSRGAQYLMEMRPRSLAYVHNYKEHDYIMGGFNGGYTEDYLKMSEELTARINLDKAMGIIAKYNDESHLNWYSTQHKFKLIPADYLYPEGVELAFSKKILVLDKRKQDGIGSFRADPNLYRKGLHARLEKSEK